MTKKQIQILDEYYSGKMPREKFLLEFGVEIEDTEFIRKELIQSIRNQK